jgi:hypothetical protein
VAMEVGSQLNEPYIWLDPFGETDDDDLDARIIILNAEGDND